MLIIQPGSSIYTTTSNDGTFSISVRPGAQLTGVGAFKGVDYFGIPNLRSYQLSVNIGF